MNKSLTIVMPAKNEKKFIRDAIFDAAKAVEKLNIVADIIVVNDGSTDETKAIVEEIKRDLKNISLINNVESRGIGGAFYQGAMASCTDYIVLLPGDNENDALSILSIFKDSHDFDLLVPYVINLSERSIFRRSLSLLYTIILNLSFFKLLKYYNGTSIYKKEIFEKIKIDSSGFFFSAEILIKAIDKNYSYKEIPVKLNQKEERKSEAIKIASLKQVINDYLKTLWWFWRNRLGLND